MSWDMELNDDMLEELYEWIDRVPMSRTKKRIERDFSDGYCVGEIIKHFLPNIIELHNFTPAHNLQQKMGNWGLLNSKVFNKFGLNVPHNITQNICNMKPGYIEVFLYNLRYKVQEKLDEQERFTARGSPRGMGQSPNGQIRGVNSRAVTQMRLDYENKVQHNLQQAEQIEVLQAKCRRMDKLLELKETRINDLTDRLSQYRPTGADSAQSHNATQQMASRSRLGGGGSTLKFRSSYVTS